MELNRTHHANDDCPGGHPDVKALEAAQRLYEAAEHERFARYRELVEAIRWLAEAR